MARWLACILLTLLTWPLLAQTPAPEEALLARKWKLGYYVEAGERIAPAPEQRNDVMDFHADHTVVSVEAGGTQHGTWSYDGAAKQLVVVDKATRERAVLKVVALDAQHCTLEFKDPDGVVLRMHMVPAEQ